MPGQHIEYHHVSKITIGTVGQPGDRVFLLQATDAVDTITLKLEKEQTRALAETAKKMLENLREEDNIPLSSVDKPKDLELDLAESANVLFIIGQMGLGFDKERKMIVLAAQEFATNEEDEPSTARFWITPAQLEALIEHGLEAVEGGRPDPSSNGHYRYPIV